MLIIYIVMIAAFIIIVSTVMIVLNKKNNAVKNELFAKTDQIAKIYTNVIKSKLTTSFIVVDKIDEKKPASFSYKNSPAYYAEAGVRKLNLTWSETTVAVISKRNRNEVVESEIEVTLEAHKEYNISFNKETNLFEIKEISTK